MVVPPSVKPSAANALCRRRSCWQFSRITTPVSIAVDDADGCEDTFAYMSDSMGYSLTAYSWRNNTSWQIQNSPLFGPNLRNPLALFLNSEYLRLSTGVAKGAPV